MKKRENPRNNWPKWPRVYLGGGNHDLASIWNMGFRGWLAGWLAGLGWLAKVAQ